MNHMFQGVSNKRSTLLPPPPGPKSFLKTCYNLHERDLIEQIVNPPQPSLQTCDNVNAKQIGFPVSYLLVLYTDKHCEVCIKTERSLYPSVASLDRNSAEESMFVCTAG